jgi:rhodanese-related sulfurtransferase
VTNKPMLAEPIIIAQFWANRRGEAVLIQLREFEGLALVDVRKHYTAADGKLAPTAKGIAITIRKLPDLAAGIAKAMHKARELGLIAGGDGPGAAS